LFGAEETLFRFSRLSIRFTSHEQSRKRKKPSNIETVQVTRVTRLAELFTFGSFSNFTKAAKILGYFLACKS
jgi:hypothetical protein